MFFCWKRAPCDNDQGEGRQGELACPCGARPRSPGGRRYPCRMFERVFVHLVLCVHLVLFVHVVLSERVHACVFVHVFALVGVRVGVLARALV